ncbi:MAG TPA: hypothetical protein VFX20_19950 [Steroidobacteraceae bacterium]|nr:hypothetical protein [Steroidobacteraceae bacterium]
MDLTQLSYQELTKLRLKFSTAELVTGLENPDYSIEKTNEIKAEMQRRNGEQNQWKTQREAQENDRLENARRQLIGARGHLDHVLKNSGPDARELAERIARKNLDDAARRAKAAGLPTIIGDFIHETAEESWLG